MDSSALESSGKRPDHPPAWTWRRMLGVGIVVAGGMVLLGDLYFWLAAQNPRVQDALLAGSLAAFATALGTVPVALSQTFSQRVSDSVMGFGAGVMLAACAFSLVIPGIAAAKAQGAGAWGAGAWGAGGIVGGGILVGALLLLLLDRLVPHEHFVKGLEGPSARAMKRVWLFVLAITLHNLPEGMAIGVAFGGTDTLGAQALATGISIQDIPEGLVVAMALRGVGYRKLTAVGLGIVSGLIEPIAAVFGAAAIGLSAGLLPWGLAMAAGAMLFVISHEIIPESHRQGHETCATVGLMLGFVVMMLLDTALS